MQIVGHRGGTSEHELWGLMCDLTDAFDETSPEFEIVLDAENIDADIVVMLAGATIRAGGGIDWGQLGKINRSIFQTYADALVKKSPKSIVTVQSIPVELGVQIFAEKLGRERVLGTGALSDTQRFRSEIARILGIHRNRIMSPVFGQHGSNMVPIYSLIHVRGVKKEAVDALIDQTRMNHTARTARDNSRGPVQVIEFIKAKKCDEAYTYIQGLCPDLGAAVRPIFTDFTSDLTTEIATAHSVAEIVQAFAEGAYHGYRLK